MKKNRLFFWSIIGVLGLLFGIAIFWPIKSDTTFTRLDVKDEVLIAKGKKIYALHCASCHGVNLEGQPSWMERGINGLYPAPPQNDSGHSWRHPDQYLINVVKNGLFENGKPTNMLAFDKKLNEMEILSVLTYIKSEWSDEKKAIQQGIQENSIPTTVIYNAD